MLRAQATLLSVVTAGLLLVAPAPSFAGPVDGFSSGGLRISYAEPVRFAGLEARALRGATNVTASRASFDAYGRRFDMALESNDRLRARLSARTRSATQNLRLLRGTLAGLPGSWLRLAIDGDRYSGLIWDGRDLYVVAPASEVAPDATAPLAATGDAPMVYRLSDVQVAPGSRLCATVRRGTTAGVTTGLDQYQALVAELRSKAAATLTGRIAVSVVADFEFYQDNSSSVQTSQNQILSIFNQVDGIFSSQVGVEIELGGNITVFDNANDPFTTTTDSETLLDQVGDYRATTPSLRSTGITHLVTGRELAGSTVGIAYVGSLCESHFSVSLSQRTGGQALIAAHELGHNFGAPHDGETPGAGEPPNPCASVPQTFLMAPALNGSSTFSQCSLDQMAPVVAQAESSNCILPAVADADVEAVADIDSVGTIIDRSFPLSATITNTGSLTATGVTLRFAVPANLSVVSFSSTGGLACATSVGGVDCTTAGLAANASANAQLSLNAAAAGNYTVTATAGATNDTNAANAVASFAVLAATAPDLALELPAAPASIEVDQETSLSISVRNNGTVPAGSIQVQTTLPATVAFVSATNDSTINCSQAAALVTCTLATINAGAVRTISLRVRGAAVGSSPLDVALTSTDDGTAGNNSGQLALTVDAASASGGGGGGGGGGSFDVLALLALALTSLLRHWRRGSAQPQGGAPGVATRTGVALHSAEYRRGVAR